MSAATIIAKRRVVDDQKKARKSKKIKYDTFPQKQVETNQKSIYNKRNSHLDLY